MALVGVTMCSVLRGQNLYTRFQVGSNRQQASAASCTGAAPAGVEELGLGAARSSPETRAQTAAHVAPIPCGRAFLTSGRAFLTSCKVRGL